MKFGISSYSLTWAVGVPGYDKPIKPIGPIELLEKAREHDLRLVQIADNMPVHLMDEQLLIRIKELADQYDIALETGTRGTEVEHLKHYLSISRLLGAKTFRTIITSPDIDGAKRELKTVLPLFEQAEIAIAVENHGLHTTEQLCGLVEELNSPYLGICLDTVNSFGALEYPKDVIRNLVPHIVNLHIKDFEIKRHTHQMGFEIIGTPAGKGRLDMDHLLGYIRECGKEPTAVLELWTPYTGDVQETVRMEMEWFLQSILYLKSV